MSVNEFTANQRWMQQGQSSLHNSKKELHHSHICILEAVLNYKTNTFLATKAQRKMQRNTDEISKIRVL